MVQPQRRAAAVQDNGGQPVLQSDGTLRARTPAAPTTGRVPATRRLRACDGQDAYGQWNTVLRPRTPKQR